MSDWAWVIFVLAVQLGCMLLKPQNSGRGKRITMPMRRRFKFYDNPWCRVLQIFTLVGLQTVLSIPMGHKSFYVYCILMCALYIDDYFSDDDDHKKFWDTVRNKIKWKMELPKPVKVGEIA